MHTRSIDEVNTLTTEGHPLMSLLVAHHRADLRETPCIDWALNEFHRILRDDTPEQRTADYVAALKYRQQEGSWLLEYIVQEFPKEAADFELALNMERVAATDSFARVLLEKGMCGAYENGASCSICTEMVDLGDRVTQLPCEHWFHPSCVAKWLRHSDTCPLCRRDVLLEW